MKNKKDFLVLIQLENDKKICYYIHSSITELNTFIKDTSSIKWIIEGNTINFEKLNDYNKVIKINDNKHDILFQIEDILYERNNKQFKILQLLDSNKWFQMKYIKQWTGLHYNSLIFDSEIHNWKENESEFDTLILNKENLLFFN